MTTSCPSANRRSSGGIRNESTVANRASCSSRHYNGILKLDEHYIPIKRDLSNVREAIAKFRDNNYRLKIADTAFEYVMAGHTYNHRVVHLLSLVD